MAGSDNVALVLTMTASEEEQFGEEAIRAAREVDSAIRVLRRTRQVEVSAEREELYEILKRRLFEGDPATREEQADRVARAYWDYYRSHADDFPQQVQAPEYRNLMVRAYPSTRAHRGLRDRWGSIQGFQRTRGVLRLLALIIADLYRRQHPAPVIQPAHVNLDNGQIRAELLEYVDNRGGTRQPSSGHRRHGRVQGAGQTASPAAITCVSTSAPAWLPPSFLLIAARPTARPRPAGPSSGPRPFGPASCPRWPWTGWTS